MKKKYHVYVKHSKDEELVYDDTIESEQKFVAKILKGVKEEFQLADAQAHEVIDNGRSVEGS